ncbi:MAG TPA: hypothetical protein VNX27_07710 [Chthoniobacterales bacterium]|jgi:hypothetical protein|nr:hypothetical protein [Chthoniobacterales bacterium]
MRPTAKVLMSIRCPAFVIFICLANAALADTLKEKTDNYVGRHIDAELFSGVVLVASDRKSRANIG